MFLQLAFPDAIYLVDAIEGGSVLIEACKPALESDYVTKVIHDCKRDSEVSDLFDFFPAAFSIC
jgi:exonuclease 3'-5' domain-containing protein 1